MLKRLARLALFAGLLSVLAQIAEERMLRKIDSTPNPDGWKPPRFPDGHNIAVPVSDGAVLSIAIAGPDDGPVALLVHGVNQCNDTWGLVGQRLVDEGWRAIGLHQRGHAGSTVGTDGFSAERLGSDLGEAIEALDLHEVVLVGHSLGGIAVQSLLTGPRRPATARVRAGLLVSTTAATTDPARRIATAFLQRDLYELLYRHPNHGRVMRRFAFGPTPSSDMIRALGDAGEHLSRADELAAVTGVQGYDVRDELGSVKVPLTVLCGTRDLVTPISDSRTIAKLSGAELVELTGVGHMLPWEAPDSIVDACTSATATGDTQLQI